MKNYSKAFLAITIILIGCAKFSFGQIATCPGTHCTAGLYSIGCSVSFIDLFEMADMSNPASACGSTPPTDAQCTGFVINVKQGETYNVRMTPDPVWTTNFTLWIDFDQNNSFDDPGEFMFTTPFTAGSKTAKVTIPSTAKPGKTRLRIRSSNSVDPIELPEDACKQVDYGEAEDYELVIAECTAIAEITPGEYVEKCIGDSVVLTANIGKSYRWNTQDTTQSITVYSPGIYKVEVLAENGCKAQDSVEIGFIACNPTGIQLNKLPDFNCFYQSGELVFNHLPIGKSYNTFIYGVDGKLLFTGVLPSSHQLKINIPQSGIYFIQLRENSEVLSGKVFVSY